MGAPGLLFVAGTCLTGDLTSVAYAAHSGGLNSQGCRNERKSENYDCDRGSSLGSKRSALTALGLAQVAQNEVRPCFTPGSKVAGYPWTRLRRNKNRGCLSRPTKGLCMRSARRLGASRD